MKMNPSRFVVRAFTLIEVLVVVGVLAVLVALVVPASRKAVKSSQRSGSLSNLKSIAAMAELYSTDHNSYVVRYESSDWTPGDILYVAEYLPKYYGEENYKVFRRPGDKRVPAGVGGNIFLSYAINIDLPRRSGVPRKDGSFQRSILPTPSQTMLFMETVGNGGLQFGHQSHLHFDADGPQGKNAVAFLDGHAALVTREIMSGNGTPGSLTAEGKTLWFGYPDAVGRRDY